MNWKKITKRNKAIFLQQQSQLQKALTSTTILQQILQWGQQDHFKTKQITSQIGQIDYGHGEHTIAIIICNPLKQVQQAAAAYQALQLIKMSKISIHQRLRLIILAEDNSNNLLKQYSNTQVSPAINLVAAANSPSVNSTKLIFQFPAANTVTDTFIQNLQIKPNDNKVQATLMTLNWHFIQQAWSKFIQQIPFLGHLDIAERQIKISLKAPTPTYSWSVQQALLDFLLELPVDISSQKLINLLNDLRPLINIKYQLHVNYQHMAGGSVELDFLPSNKQPFIDKDYQKCQLLSDHYQIPLHGYKPQSGTITISNTLVSKILTAYQAQTGIPAQQLSLIKGPINLSNSFLLGSVLQYQNQQIVTINDACTLTAIYAAVLVQLAG